MTERTRVSKVPGTVVYFSQGDRSFTDLGARRYKDVLLVDLLFRSAGVGGELFRQLEPEVQRVLERLYPGSVRIERDRTRMIALPRHVRQNASQE